MSPLPNKPVTLLVDEWSGEDVRNERKRLLLRENGSGRHLIVERFAPDGMGVKSWHFLETIDVSAGALFSAPLTHRVLVRVLDRYLNAVSDSGGQLPRALEGGDASVPE